MKRVINVFIFAFTFVISAFAQDCDIQIAAAVDDANNEIPAASKRLLESVLTRLATENGATKDITFAEFLISPKIDVLDKHVVAGPPPSYVNNLGVTLYITNVYTKEKIANAYFEVNGVGQSEIKSFNNAIQNLKPENKKMQAFMATAKTKILAYYDSHYSQILQDAQRKAGLKQYEEALAMICAIPTCSKGGKEATTTGLKIYAQCRDRYAQQLLSQAQAIWAANPTAEGAQQVAAILVQIDPEASCKKDVNALVANIKKTVRTDIDWEKNTTADLLKLRIEAIRAIGVAYGSHNSVIVPGMSPVIVK